MRVSKKRREHSKQPGPPRAGTLAAGGKPDPIRRTHATREPHGHRDFTVTGLTCGHCIGAITSELKEVPGVADVEIDLAVSGTSTLSILSEETLTDGRVLAALHQAGGYALAPS